MPGGSKEDADGINRSGRPGAVSKAHRHWKRRVHNEYAVTEVPPAAENRNTIESAIHGSERHKKSRKSQDLPENVAVEHARRNSAGNNEIADKRRRSDGNPGLDEGQRAEDQNHRKSSLEPEDPAQGDSTNQKNEKDKFDNERVMTPSRRRWNICGVILQSLFFMINAYVWVIGLACLVGGFILGFDSSTIQIWDFKWLDFIATTPATIFITYGIVIMILTSVGCFAATGGNRAVLIVFGVLVLIVIIFDLAFGIWLFFSLYSFQNFVVSLQKSLHGYGIPDAKRVGIITLPPTVYWDHVQTRARCCGVYFYEEWETTPIGKNYSLPNSCCNEDYEHRHCGEFMLRHPDSEHHSVIHLVHPMGLMKRFPKSLEEAFAEVNPIGVSVGVAIILCLIFAIFLFVIVTLKKYKAGGGPETRPAVIPNEQGDAPRPNQNRNENKGRFPKKNKVAPEPRQGPVPSDGDKKGREDDARNPYRDPGGRTKRIKS